VGCRRCRYRRSRFIRDASALVRLGAWSRCLRSQQRELACGQGLVTADRTHMALVAMAALFKPCAPDGLIGLFNRTATAVPESRHASGPSLLGEVQIARGDLIKTGQHSVAMLGTEELGASILTWSRSALAPPRSMPRP